MCIFDLTWQGQVKEFEDVLQKSPEDRTALEVCKIVLRSVVVVSYRCFSLVLGWWPKILFPGDGSFSEMRWSPTP